MNINIVLTEDNLPDKIPFYCMRCRSQLFQNNRGILVVWTGNSYPATEIPKGMGWLELKCHSCKVYYNFYYQ